MKNFETKYLSEGVRIYSPDGSRLAKTGDEVTLKKNLISATGQEIKAGTRTRISRIILEPKEERGMKIQFKIGGFEYPFDKKNFK